MSPIAWVVEHSLQASERFRHLTVLPKRLSFESAPAWANWIVNWKDGSQEFREYYPWPHEGESSCIVARPREQKGCQRCGKCRILDFNNCKNRRDEK